MGRTVHTPGVTYIKGDVRVVLDLKPLYANVQKAQDWLLDRVLEDCRARMPVRTGSLTQRSYVDRDSAEVVFPGPYGRFQYGGLVMVDPVTGSPWARRGAVKVLTDRPLHYSQPGAVDHWFDHAFAEDGEYWIDGCAKIIAGGGTQ